MRTSGDEPAIVCLVLDVVRLSVEALFVQAGLVYVARVVETRAESPGAH